MKEIDFQDLEYSFFKHVEHSGVADFENNTIEMWLEENGADFDHDDIEEMIEVMFCDELQLCIDDPDSDWFQDQSAIKLQNLYVLFPKSKTHKAVRSLFKQLNNISITKRK